MKKVYEAPEFLSEDILDIGIVSGGDNTQDDPFTDGGDEEATEFILG